MNLLHCISAGLLVAMVSCNPAASKRAETDNNDKQDTLMIIKNLNIDVTAAENIEPGLDCGVSGAFTGVLGGRMIQAGGCNFPEDPLGAASKKKFYEGIYAVETGDSTWQPVRIGTLPKAMAYGVAVTYPEGMVLIGGSDASGSFSEVYSLKMEGDATRIESLPSLPGTIDNFAATEIDSTIYVAGGSYNGQPSNKVFKLDLKEKGSNWQELATLPGNPRVQPVMAHGKDAEGNEALYLWGGFAGKGERRDASLNTDGLKFDFAKGEWKLIASPENQEGEAVSTGGGCITVLPDGRIAEVGGVNKDIFLEALQNQAPDYLTLPIEWYRFNPNLLIFDPTSEKWSVGLVSKEIARAGAGIVSLDGCIMVAGGELKPRIRTAVITVIK